MFLIGLTGGIGSGKTTVSKMFEELGVPVVDADVVSRELTACGGKAVEAVRAAFGGGSVDDQGAMNRAFIRERVFRDENEKKKLESILHPMIQKECLDRLASLKAPYAVVSVPLLVESAFWLQKVDRVLVIDLPEEEQIKRTVKRDSLTEEIVKKIIAKQASRKERLNAADDVIENYSDVSSLRLSVAKLHKNIMQTLC